MEMVVSPAPVSFALKRIGAYLGGEITGIDLREELSSQVVHELKVALAEYGVLVFPNQPISQEDQRRFGRYFGTLTVHPFSTSTLEAPELIVYDNKEGNPPPRTDIWHSDETFRECPPMATMLHSKIVPALGGDTCFCSMEAAYNGLSDRMQRHIDGLEALHDFKIFKEYFSDETPAARAKKHKFEELYPLMTHPVVRVHPVTGRKSIFVNHSFTVGIKGLAEGESRALLDALCATAHTLEYQYRHRWEPEMVVLWDNRSVQHCAVHDYYPQRRMMERITIRGDRPVGPGAPAPLSDIQRRKVPWLGDFPDRPKRQFELAD